MCDSQAEPDAIGIRARIPGTPLGRRAFARFTVQWFSQTEQDWLPVGGQPSSPWIDTDSPFYVWLQQGWTFRLKPPPPGVQFLTRGIVEVEWRAGERVLRRRTLVTRPGHPDNPAGLSRGSCSIKR